MEIKGTASQSQTYINMLIHGQSGCGKTRLAATLDVKPLIINVENGLLSLKGNDIPYVDCRSMDDLRNVYAELAKGEHQFETIIIDSISEIGELCLTEAMAALKQRAAAEGKKPEPRQAYGALQEAMMPLLRAFRDLPMNCVLIAKQERVRDEETGMTLASVLMPGSKVGQALPYLTDITVAMHSKVNENGETVEWLQCQRDNQFDAKDRSGTLEAYMPANLQLIFDTIKLSKAKNHENKC